MGEVPQGSYHDLAHIHRSAPRVIVMAWHHSGRMSKSARSLDFPSCEYHHPSPPIHDVADDQSFVLFAVIVLTIWNVPDGLKFCAFYFGGFSGMASPILYSFVNSRLPDNYGERGLVISSMMTFGFCSQIWVPLFTFPTVQAPQFPHGYPACVVFEVAMWGILMFGIVYMARWKVRHPDLNAVVEVQDMEGRSTTASDDDQKEDEKSDLSTPTTPADTQAVLVLTASREKAS